MTGRARLLRSLGVVLVACSGLAACGGGGGAIPSDAVVKVGSTPITKTAVEHWMGIAASTTKASNATAKTPAPVPPEYSACVARLRAVETTPAVGKSRATEAKLKSQCAVDYSADKQAALSFLIASHWILGEAAHLGVKVTNKEVEQQFAATKKKYYPTEASFRKYLARTGYTVSDLLLKTRVENVLPSKVEGAIVARAEKSVTKSEIASYYKSNRSSYHTSVGRGALILMVTTSAEAEAARSEIMSGQSFTAVAKRVSVLHTSQQGGVYLSAVRGREEKPLEKAMFAAPYNVVTGPVKTRNGYYVFEVKKTLPAKQQPLAEAESTIRASLVTKKVEAALTEFSTTYKKRWKAKTDCRPGYVIAECK